MATGAEAQGPAPPPLVGLSDGQRLQAMARWAVLRPHLEDGVPLPRAAVAAGVAPRSAERWLARFRQGGLAGLARPSRSDRGQRHVPEALVGLIEGLVLVRPAPSLATVHRTASAVAAAKGWPQPSYASVRRIARGLPAPLVTIAQEGTSPTGRPTTSSTGGSQRAPTTSGRPITPSSTSWLSTQAPSPGRPGRGSRLSSTTAAELSPATPSMCRLPRQCRRRRRAFTTGRNPSPRAFAPTPRAHPHRWSRHPRGNRRACQL